MTDDRPSLESVKEEIAREIARVHEQSYGEAASNVKVEVHPSFVVVLMDIELSPAEITLMGAGNEESVKTTREAYQEAIAPTFKAIVERATGRTVQGFVSRTAVDEGENPWSVEVFRLAG